jgi:hypothetical protein
MTSASGSSKRFPYAILWSAALFLCLWARDYPKPNLDDLYYLGAGLHLAEGGDFSNPLIVRQEYPSHYFFVYPPFHSYALAAWLKVAGLNTHSMTAFYMLMYFFAAVTTIAVLRKYHAPSFLEWLAPLAVCTSLHATGLRSEAVSVGVTMAGFGLIECLGRNVFANFFGFLILMLGASTAPRLTFFSGALVVYSAYKLFAEPETGRAKLVALLPAAAAALCAGALFLAMINFRVAEFWHTFHVHAQLVNGRRFDRFLGFMNENRYLNGSQSPLVWALGALLLFAWPGCRSSLAQIGLAVLGGFFFEALAGGLSAGSLWYLSFALLLFSAAVMENSPAWIPKMAVALVFLFLLANCEIIIIEFQRLRGKITSTRGGQEQLARDLRSTPEHPVLVDSWTARYIYNYQIPEGFLDIQAAAHYPKAHVVQQWFPNDIYVIGPENVNLMKRFTFLVQSVRMRSLFGLPNRQICNDPCMAFVIPADACLPHLDGP